MRSVLVVDDHIDLSEMVQYILTHEGYRVILAHDSRSALLAAARELPSLILMDIMLPDRDGAQTVRMLREREETKDIPVVFLTALASDESTGAENLIVVDGKTYSMLSKALGRDELLKRIKYFVENS